MDLGFLRRLVRLMRREGLVEVEVEEEGRRVRLRRPTPAPPLEAGSLPPASLSAAPAAGAPAAAPAEEGVVDFRSPMVGTFYRSPSPEAEVFVRPGDRVEPATVLCIIEAMKVMNEVRAEIAGEILDVLVENGQPVEFGQPLFRLRVR